MSEPQRLLFVTLSNIGDAVMSTPALLRFAERYPDCPVDIVARPQVAPLFANYPRLGELVVHEKDRSFRGRLRYLKRLRRHRYRAVLDLKSPLTPRLLRAKDRYAKVASDRDDEHAVLDHVRVMEPNLPESDVPALCLWPDANQQTTAERLLPGRACRLAIGPGARYPGKVWPASHYAELMAGLTADDSAIEFVFFGDANDARITAELAASTKARCVNLCGQTDLMTAAAALARCTAFVGNDSGLGHIAAAMAVPTVTVFGIGRPTRYRPWHPHGTVVLAPGQDLTMLSTTEVLPAVRLALLGD